MPSSRSWPKALLAGVACSARSAAGPAVLAARGRVSGKAGTALIVGGVGELVADKLPFAPDRTATPAVAGRVASGAYTGNAIAGPVGAVASAVGAGVGTFSTWRMRKLVGERTGLPDPVVALGEDLLAYGAVFLATMPDRNAASAGPEVNAEGHINDEGGGEDLATESQAPSLLKSAAIGVMAGLAGTAAMTIAQGAEFVLTGAEPSDAPATVADKAMRKLGIGAVTHKAEPDVNQAMHWAFGTSWGIPYGILAARSKIPPEVSGPILGLIVWSAALAHQPATGVAEGPWKRSQKSLSSEALFHLIYGFGAGGALRWIRNSQAK